MAEFPRSLNVIRSRLKNLGILDVGRKEKIIANIIVGQMLPASAVRGGTGLKIRFGDLNTRASRDLDVAHLGDLQEFIEEFRNNLSIGWNGFTGQLLLSKKESNPKDIPLDYVTVTVYVKLQFQGSEWLRQEIDLGHDEIGDTLDPDLEIPDELADWFEISGLPRPSPIPVIKVHHQIAQKIHALASDPQERIHDLVDLQVIFDKFEVDQILTSETCKRLFKSRKTIGWPPFISALPNSETSYLDAADETKAKSNLVDAIAWLNWKINWLNL